jgi:hypothetical protein
MQHLELSFRRSLLAKGFLTLAVGEAVEVSMLDFYRLVAMLAKNFGPKECLGVDISSH